MGMKNYGVEGPYGLTGPDAEYLTANGLPYNPVERNKLIWQMRQDNPSLPEDFGLNLPSKNPNQGVSSPALQGSSTAPQQYAQQPAPRREFKFGPQVSGGGGGGGGGGMPGIMEPQDSNQGSSGDGSNNFLGVDKDKLQAFLGNTAYAISPKSFGGRMGAIYGPQGTANYNQRMQDIKELKKEARDEARAERTAARNRKNQSAAASQQQSYAIQKQNYAAGVKAAAEQEKQDTASGILDVMNTPPVGGTSDLAIMTPEDTNRSREESISNLTPVEQLKLKMYQIEQDSALQKENAKFNKENTKWNQGAEERDINLQIKKQNLENSRGGRSSTPTIKGFPDGTMRQYNPKSGVWDVIGKAGSDNKTPTTAVALKRTSEIRKSMATLEKTDIVTAFLAQSNPELAKMIGQKIDPELKAQLMQSWNDEIAYYEPFTGTKRESQKAKQSWKDYQ